MDILKLLKFLTSRYATIRKMFNEYKRWRRFTDLSEAACSLIIDAVEKGERLLVNGDRIFAGDGYVVASGAKALIDELESYSLIKCFGGSSFVPTWRARRRIKRLRRIKYDFFKESMPDALRGLFTENKIKKGGVVLIRFQQFVFPGKEPDVEICARFRKKERVDDSCFRIDCGVGTLIEILRKEELVDNWRVGNVRHTFTEAIEDARILAILNNPAKQPLEGVFTERAERVAKLLKK